MTSTVVTRRHEMTELSDRATRAAKNQSLFREINERIESLNEAFGDILPVSEWVCECADDTCVERFVMTVEAYEKIRAHPARFPILPGHEVPGVERVVERHEGYVVVEKLGEAKAIATSLDPRSDGSP
jgi:hypothetical protein